MTTTSFQDALAAIDGWIADGAVGGVSAAVWHKGEIVAERQAGEAQPGIPVTADTLFALASVSKPFTATAVMRLVDRGEFSLDTPIAAIVPEFGETDDPFADDAYPQLEALRDRVTFRHVLSHTSGLPENIGVKRLRMREQPSLTRMLDVMCGLPLQDVPGEVLRYSNVGMGVAARAAERAAGIDFLDLLQAEVLTPWDLPGVIARPAEDIDASIAIVQDPSGGGTPIESYNSRY
ncbi:MAG TPA: serine hydrolase domain-containing protein, partial [Thermomicrobiales bacterium]|nr:serine hydrolase domain-containing protein [Thermomicrobiales bacterium]